LVCVGFGTKGYLKVVVYFLYNSFNGGENIASTKSQNTWLKFLLVGIVVFGLAWYAGGGEMTMFTGEAEEVEDGPVAEIGEGAYEYDIVLTNFNAYDGAGTAVNPTGYAYVDEKPSDWGDEYEFQVESGAHESTDQVSFSDGEGDVDLDAGKTYYYHFKLDGYKDAWKEVTPPTSGDYRPVDMRDTGTVADLTLKEYDTTTIASSLSLSGDDDTVGEEVFDRAFEQAADDKVIDPARLKITNVDDSDDVSEYTVEVVAGGESVEIDVLEHLEYAGSTDAQTMDTKDYPDIAEELKKLDAEDGEEVMYRVDVTLDTNPYSDDGTENLGTVTLQDQEGSALIDAVDQTLSLS